MTKSGVREKICPHPENLFHTSPPEAEGEMEDREADWNRDVLERIVALLFALAGLADLAAGAPLLRRRQVLGILGHGEAEARAFVIGIATGATVSGDALETTGDAALLAARLRTLALLLCVLLARRFAFPRAADPLACRPPRRASVPAVRRPETPSASDTS